MKKFILLGLVLIPALVFGQIGVIYKFTTINALPEPLRSNVQNAINFGSEIDEDDFIIADAFGAIISVVKQTDYSSNEMVYNQVHELIGRRVVREWFSELRSQSLTQAQEAEITSMVNIVLNALTNGFIRGAKDIATDLIVDGPLTTLRKNYLLARIDAAILEL